jgi:hypothetical protein
MQLMVRAPDGNGANYWAESYRTTATGTAMTFAHARGTLAAPVPLNVNDQAGVVAGTAWARDAANTADVWQRLGILAAVVDSKDAEGRTGGRWEFHTSSGISAGPSNKMTLSSLGNLSLGVSGAGSNAVATLALGPGTAPTTSPLDSVQLWEADRGATAGKGSLHIRTEDTTSHVFGDLSGIATLTPLFPLHVNGRLGFGVPNSGGQDSNLSNSQATMYLDAGETNLLVRVKTSAGTLKTATIALV